MQISRKLKQDLAFILFQIGMRQISTIEALLQALETLTAEARKQLDATQH